MDVKNGPGGDDYQNKAAAIFVEGEELRRRRIYLCREASGGAGRSSSSVYYYCRRAEGVPFKWEKKPGTPTQLIPNEINNNILLLPLSPPPSLQSLGLPLPCFHHHTDSQQHSCWRKIKKMLQRKHANIIAQKSSSGEGGLQEEHRDRSTIHHQRENNNNNNNNVGVGDSDTEFIASLNNSNSFCSSSSSSSSSCSNAPFCYGTSRNIKAIMDEEAGKNNNSSKEPRRHKAFFRLEEEEEDDDGYGFRSLLSRLSSSSSSSSSSVVGAESSSRFYYCMSSTKGIIPFQWEIQAGAPKTPPRNDQQLLIPPLSPPPLAQIRAHCQSQTAITYSPPAWTKLWKGNKRLMAAARKKLIKLDKEMRRRRIGAS